MTIGRIFIATVLAAASFSFASEAAANAKTPQKPANLAKIKAFLATPLEYDRDWPPEIVAWQYEGVGTYAHEIKRYFLPGFNDGLKMTVRPKNLRAYVYGTKGPCTFKSGGKTLSWTGRAASWRLKDSRDLVAMAVFRTDYPAASAEVGPAAAVAVYSINEDNKLLANFTVPMTAEETKLYIAKHYSLNKLQIKWVGTKRLRSFTIPDHTPLRLVLGIIGSKEGEKIAGTLEIQPTQQAQKF